MTSASLSDLEGAGASASGPANLLDIRQLTVGFPSRRGVVLAANHVILSLSSSRTLGLVGESGCGKSVTLRSVIGMIPKPGEVLEGEVVWHGRNLVGRNGRDVRSVRGRQLSLIHISDQPPTLWNGQQVTQPIGLSSKGTPRRGGDLTWAWIFTPIAQMDPQMPTTGDNGDLGTLLWICLLYTSRCV